MKVQAIVSDVSVEGISSDKLAEIMKYLIDKQFKPVSCRNSIIEFKNPEYKVHIYQYGGDKSVLKDTKFVVIIVFDVNTSDEIFEKIPFCNDVARLLIDSNDIMKASYIVKVQDGRITKPINAEALDYSIFVSAFDWCIIENF